MFRAQIRENGGKKMKTRGKIGSFDFQVRSFDFH